MTNPGDQCKGCLGSYNVDVFGERRYYCTVPMVIGKFGSAAWRKVNPNNNCPHFTPREAEGEA